MSTPLAKEHNFDRPRSRPPLGKLGISECSPSPCHTLKPRHVQLCISVISSLSSLLNQKR